MEPDFSKAALKVYLGVAANRALVNPNTLAGWRAAVSSIFEDEADTTDVRSIDLKTSIRRYNNGHPGVLSPASLTQYEKRLGVIIAEFTKFQNDPAGYKGYGRHPTTPSASKKTENKTVTGTGRLAQSSGSVSGTGTETVTPVVAGLSYDYPIRPDFLAQVVVPRDLTSFEARRLTRFIMALAQDYDGRD
jgi:hypothetical protein